LLAIVVGILHPDFMMTAHPAGRASANLSASAFAPGLARYVHMMIAHVPAGYLLTTSLLRRCGTLPVTHTQRLLWLGLVAAALPDFDLLYFLFIDHRRHNHHSYWTHIPFWWLVLASSVYAFAALKRYCAVRLGCLVIFFNVLLHCVLDSVSSGIQWLYPLSRHYFALMPLHGHAHRWNLEIVVVCCALLELAVISLAWRRWRQQARQKTLKYRHR
jgi:inner membrane protein